MKIKYLLAALLTLTIFGCDENTGSLGLGVLPDGDQNLNGRDTTFLVTTESILSDSVYAKTSIGYVGKFSDKLFGFYECSFLAQLYCPDGLQFPSVYDPVKNPKGVMAGDTITNAELILGYTSYFGDSVQACRISVYELDKNLKAQYYTNINPGEYYSKTNGLLARKAYTAVDLSLSDSVRNETDFIPFVRFTSDKINEIGKKIYSTSKVQQLNTKVLQDLFKGIYVKSDYGDGTILYIDQINLNIRYRCHYKDSLGVNLKKKDGTDSLYYSGRTFATTREVIQANQIANNKEELRKRVAESGHTYLKTPAGIFTRAKLPLEQIANKLSNDSINGVKLTFTCYNQPETNKFSMKAPNNILLLREKDKYKFFEDNKLADGKTSFTTSPSISYGMKQYSFNNLARLVKACLSEKAAAKKAAGGTWTAEQEKKWEEENQWDQIVLIPVSVQYETSANSQNVISIQHDLQPSYVKLKGGLNDTPENKLDLQVTYTNFSGKK